MNPTPGMRRRRLPTFVETYTRDLKAEDLQRLFTRDTREAYRFFARHIDVTGLDKLPWHRRTLAHAKLLFLAFSMKLSPARHVVYEAENPAGQPFDEQGLESALVVNRRSDISAIGAAVVRAVEAHTADTRLADDLTILLLRRAIVTGAPAPAGV